MENATQTPPLTASLTATQPATQQKIGQVPHGYDAWLLADFLKTHPHPALFICKDAPRMEQIKKALAFFNPDIETLDFPAWDCLPYDRVSPNATISARRMRTLCHLQSRGLQSPDHETPPSLNLTVVLTTVAGIAQKVIPRKDIASVGLSLRTGQRVDTEALYAYFARAGFVKTPTVIEAGDYAIRGGLIDIYTAGELGPVRLDFFGDMLEGIYRFDATSQRRLGAVNAIDLVPASEIIMDAQAIERFRQQYRRDFGAASRDDPLYEAISAGQKYQGVENWVGYFYESMETLFDYLPTAQVFFDDGAQSALDERWQVIDRQYQARLDATRHKTLGGIYHPAPPERLYMDRAGVESALLAGGHNKITLSLSAVDKNADNKNAAATIGRNFMPERQNKDASLFDALSAHIAEKRKNGRVIIASFSKGARDRMENLLQDHDVMGATPIDVFTDLPNKIGTLAQVVWPLEHGFETDDLTIISEQDILGERVLRKKPRKSARDMLNEATSLSAGDLVVHIDHGIGRFKSLETITAAGITRDYLLLEYAKASRLYLPVENIDLLSRYGHDRADLDALGGAAWQSKKAKLKQRIRDMAHRLIALAAQRALRKGVAFQPSESWGQFCTDFPYTETPDQLRVIDEVLDDLGSGRPMDRLICGDVGFGKTEIALRAAFITASAGAQVALIAPTTLLARQHYYSFSERFAKTGLRVAQLSRLVSAADAKLVREGVKNGTIDIVIGTHALLSKDVGFANLGLLVIDEEQKFGVAHKEKLKLLRADVHVLTLSATPIPRSLQMSLAGLRDLSIISTPPNDRLSIRTYQSEFDSVMVRQALLREHYRGGQSFYVVPRISDLPEIQAFLDENLPEVSYITAHGQMPAGELDQRMNDFYEGRYGILLATSIVENGLDIPRANTLIVHRADSFGLAQLYQIRGRVGRSKIRAYAYLTTKAGKILTTTAGKRLRILASLTELGAGFLLASQDLDLRGAGNLLGEEQSGHIREVGYELYQDMLEEEIARLKTSAGDVTAGKVSPIISLNVPVLIPQDYVADLDVRMGLYRRLSDFETRAELDDFAAELIDRFGELPDEVGILLQVVRIKALCRRAGIARFDGGEKGASVQFHNNRFANPTGLAEYIEKGRGTVKVQDNKVIVRRDWDNQERKLKGALIIARDLAGLVGD